MNHFVSLQVPNLLTYEPAFADEVKAVMQVQWAECAEGGGSAVEGSGG